MPSISRVNQHPQRVALHNEVHARPPEALAGALGIAHIVMLADASQRAQSRAHLASLLHDHHLAPPDENTTHLRVEFGSVRLRWELHTEFVTWTFTVPGPADAPHPRLPASAIGAVPQDWLRGLPGECLCSLDLWVFPGPGSVGDLCVRELLNEQTLVGSSVAGEQAQVFTDFAIHADGASRILLFADALQPRRLGRLVQRILEIETYRRRGKRARRWAARRANWPRSPKPSAAPNATPNRPCWTGSRAWPARSRASMRPHIRGFLPAAPISSCWTSASSRLPKPGWMASRASPSSWSDA
jgi:hypothetical protein